MTEFTDAQRPNLSRKVVSRFYETRDEPTAHYGRAHQARLH